MDIRNLYNKATVPNDKSQKFSLSSVGLRNELCGVDVSGAVELMLKLDATNLGDDKLSPMAKFSILKVINFLIFNFNYRKLMICFTQVLKNSLLLLK